MQASRIPRPELRICLFIGLMHLSMTAFMASAANTAAPDSAMGIVSMKSGRLLTTDGRLIRFVRLNVTSESVEYWRPRTALIGEQPSHAELRLDRVLRVDRETGNRALVFALGGAALGYLVYYLAVKPEEEQLIKTLNPDFDPSTFKLGFTVAGAAIGFGAGWKTKKYVTEYRNPDPRP